jgi:hypothetical protein
VHGWAEGYALVADRRFRITAARRNAVDIGPLRRVIEVEPTSLPVPEEIPEPELVPEPERAPAEPAP